MRHLACTLLLLANVAVAQNWCHSQAIWHNAYADAQGGAFGYIRTEYSGDTTVYGSLCQRLEPMVNGYDQQLESPFTFSMGQRFTRGQGELVELWTGSGFDTLYWFGASPGDGWNLAMSGGGLTVLDTGMMDIDGFMLRFLIVQFDEFPAGPPQDTIVERIGFLNYYWDAQAIYLLDTGLDGLRCYSDVDIDYLTSATPCDFIMDIGELQPGSQARLFPNPSTGSATISAPPGFSRIMLTDTWGRKVHDQDLQSVTTIDFSGLYAGSYIYQFLDADGRLLFTGRWVKY